VTITDDLATILGDWDEHPEARAELLDALDYYQDHASELIAHQFLAAQIRPINLILAWPDAWPPYLDVPADPPIRQTGVGKFPYKIIFQPRKTGIWVLAYAHTSRRPGYWAHRIANPSEPKMVYKNT